MIIDFERHGPLYQFKHCHRCRRVRPIVQFAWNFKDANRWRRAVCRFCIAKQQRDNRRTKRAIALVSRRGLETLDTLVFTE